MHQIQFRLGLRLSAHCRGGAYSAHPDPLAGFKGLLLREGRKRDEEWERKRGDRGGVGKEGRGGE